MTLAQLGEEYLQQEKVLRGRIDRLNGEMALRAGREKRDLSRRVAQLYEMARNVHRIGVYLIGYYREGMYGVFE